MPNDEPGTPRDAAEAANMRAAYVRGVVDRERHLHRSRGGQMRSWNGRDLYVNADQFLVGQDAIEAAEHLYPAPTRPRVVRESTGGEFRLVGELIEMRGGRHAPEWRAFVEYIVTPERVRLWADLLANPTEPVEDA